MSVIFTEGSLGHVVLGGDVRFGVIPNYLAVTLPVTTALGSYAFATTNLQPGVVLTLPLADQIDLNGSVRRSFYLHEDFEPFRWWLYNAGLGIVVAPGWRLRPEFGWMVSDDSTDRTVYMQFGVGITRQVAE